MNAAMARYASLPEFTVEQLIQAYEEAEALIGDLPSGPRPAVMPHPRPAPTELRTRDRSDWCRRRAA